MPSSPTEVSREETSGSPSGGKPGGGLAINTLYNFLGRLLPMGAALFCIPLIVEGLGVEKFGVLTLAWMIVGYFGIFDLGVGRSTTRFVAKAIEDNRTAEIPGLVWTALGMLLLFGLIGGGLFAVLSPWLVRSVFNVSPELHLDTIHAFWCLAASIPFILGASGGRGVLEGYQKFGLANLIRVPASLFNFVAPVVVLLVWKSLFAVVLALSLGRAVVLFIYLIAALRCFGGLSRSWKASRTVARRLLGFGGWLTATNIFGAAMSFGYVDRFIVSSKIDMSAVAYYSTPFEVIAKYLIFSGALVTTLFPMFSAMSSGRSSESAALQNSMIRYLLALMSGLIFATITFAEPGLRLWLGEEFATNSTLVAQLLAVGILMISLGSITSSAIQGAGRPDLTAKRHMIQLPLYMAACWLASIEFGLVGVAAVWVIYAVTDFIVIQLLSYRITVTPNSRFLSEQMRLLAFSATVVGSAFAVATIESMATRIAIAAGALAVILLIGWRFLLNSDDRARLRSARSRFLSSAGSANGEAA